MGTLSYPYTLTPGTPENVSNVQANFDAIAAVLNGNVDSANIANNGVTDTEVAAAARNLFPQLVTAAARKINFGTTTLTWAAAQFAFTNAAHGLGVVPIVVLAFPLVPAGQTVPNVYANQAPDATNVYIGGSTAGGTTQTTTVYWLAIG